MNSFESDIKRAVFSPGFWSGIIILLVILNKEGINSDLFRISVPVVSTLPYSTAWLRDVRCGFIKFYLIRTNIKSYITGKIFACCISGGMVVAGSLWIFENVITNAELKSEYLIFFLIGGLWSSLASILAVWTNNSPVAYGGAFVICYLMIIINERYFDNLYCLYPNEWMLPANKWVFGNDGIKLMLAGIIIILMFIYYELVRRKIKNV